MRHVLAALLHTLLSHAADARDSYAAAVETLRVLAPSVSASKSRNRSHVLTYLCTSTFLLWIRESVSAPDLGLGQIVSDLALQYDPDFSASTPQSVIASVRYGAADYVGALELLAACSPRNTLGHVCLQHNLALCFLELGLADDAMAYFDECVSLIRSCPDSPQTSSVSASLDRLGARISYARRDYSRSLHYVKRALARVIDEEGMYTLSAAKLIFYASHLFVACGDARNALDCGVRAVEVYERVLGVSAVDTAHAYLHVSHVMACTGQRSHAVVLCALARDVFASLAPQGPERRHAESCLTVLCSNLEFHDEETLVEQGILE
jgi:tetratricopeptide (TPR) repeat protein